MNLEKGFLVSGHYEDREGELLLTYYGIGTNGPFLLEFTNENIVFFIPRGQKNLPISNKINYKRKSINLLSFSQEKTDALYFSSAKQYLEAKRSLDDQKIKIFEGDVSPVERFLMERFINISIEFSGTPQILGKTRRFINPQIKKSFYYPSPSLFSFDIETGMNGDLYSIAYDFRSGEGNKKSQFVMMVGDPKNSEKNLQFFTNEFDLITTFIGHFNKLDPDIIIGWHVIGFDINFLKRKCDSLGIEFNLGRDNKPFTVYERKGIGFFADIPGRIVIDGPPALKGAHYKFKNFKLDTVAEEVLKKNKDITGNVNKVEEIEYRFKNDKKALAKYNLQDSILVTEIFQKTKIVDHYLKRSLLTGQFYNEITMPTKSFDFYYLPRLHRKGHLAPNYSDLLRSFSNSGGMVLTPPVGLFEHVLVFDFISLYPSIIETFKIDPLSRLLAKESPLKTPCNISFSKEKNILPEYITELKEKREQLKDKDPEFAKAIKILMNSFYGVMGSSNSRFYHAEIPQAITEIGKWYLNRFMDFVKNKGAEIIYGDTDSLFIKIKSNDRFELDEKGRLYCKEFNSILNNDLKRYYKTENKVEIRLEKHFQKLFFPQSRTSEEAAKKKYVGLLQNGDQTKIYFSGMEMVRSDWTEMAQSFQYQLFQNLFNNQEIDTYIKDYIKRLKEGEFDQQLSYTKKMTKDLSEYTKNIPIHVKAAMLLPDRGKNLREITYYMTRRGPVPEQLPHDDIDYEHYINKQMSPIANNVLQITGKNFDDLVGGDQLSLFGQFFL